MDARPGGPTSKRQPSPEGLGNRFPRGSERRRRGTKPTARRYLFESPKDRRGDFVSSHTVHTVSAAHFYPAANARNRTQVTFGLVLPCRKTHLATYCKHGKALSLRVDDIGRRRPLTRPRPVRQLPVVSALSASEGWRHRCPVPDPIPVTKSPTIAMTP